VVTAALAAVTMFSLSGCGGPMQPEELGRSVDTLSSSASEGALIARDLARNRTKNTFARVRMRELGETVDHEAEKLSDATPQESIKGKKLEAVKLAEDISDALGKVQVSIDNRARAVQAAADLDDLSKRAEDLSKGL
jgi:hypothetical protein